MIMQGQLEFPFAGRPDSNEGVKPRDREPVAEHDTAEAGIDLTNGKENLLDQLLDPGNIAEACKKVKSNRGAAGVDGITTGALDEFMTEHWLGIADRIRSNSYRPQPVRRVEIPKADGSKRLLGIPTVIDRVIQQALLQILTPIFDPYFSESSYGFRPGRSAHDAVPAARNFMEEGYYIVVDIDLEKFFDRVNHDILMSRVARKIADKTILRLIRRYLDSGVMLNGVCVATEEGVPQGGPLSPLLANILLDDLDKELEKRGHKFCRYADDCNIYVKGRRSGERVFESIVRFLSKRLRLTVNEEKSAVDRPSARKFLGFSFLRTGFGVKICISRQSIKKLKDKIREHTRVRRGNITLEERIKVLRRYLVGWMGYYALTDDPSILGNITSWMRRRMRMVVWNQWKKPIARFRGFRRFGLTAREARMAAYNSRGKWWNSRIKLAHIALGNQFWKRSGLPDLSLLHLSVRQSW